MAAETEATSPTRMQQNSPEPEQLTNPVPPADENESQQPATHAPAAEPRKRPKLDLSGGLTKKRTVFGQLLGTLNKAKLEDKKRSATDAAKKRQLIDQRLAAKIAKETESVRRAEESKRDRTMANRKEEEVVVRDSIHRLRRTRLLVLAGFLCTSDEVREDADGDGDEEMQQDDNGNDNGEDRDRTEKTNTSRDPLKPPPRSHPPPIYFLPSVLLPSQRRFIEKRKNQVKDALEKEHAAYIEKRKEAIEEIVGLRNKAVREMEMADADGDDHEGDRDRDREADRDREDRESVAMEVEPEEDEMVHRKDGDEAVEY